MLDAFTALEGDFNLPSGSRPRNTMVSLDDVPLGVTVRVRDVDGSDPVAIRLLEMGLTPGIDVRLLGRAPFGDPLELEVRGYRLSIRRQEAARVTVGDR
jgi:ferrous iron transport protein A